MSTQINSRVLLLVLFIIVQTTNSSTDGYNAVLQHDLGNGFFARRGEIHFPTMKGEYAEIMGQRELNITEVDMLNTLGTTNGTYRLRVEGQLSTPGKEKDNTEETQFVMAYADAKGLICAGLHDTVTILTDGLGNIISMEVKPQKNTAATELENFSTILIVDAVGPGPMPDTAGFLNKIKEEKLQKEKADKDPKSFIGKYWMYLLPVVFMVMMSSANQQQQ